MIVRQDQLTSVHGSLRSSLAPSWDKSGRLVPGRQWRNPIANECCEPVDVEVGQRRQQPQRHQEQLGGEANKK